MRRTVPAEFGLGHRLDQRHALLEGKQRLLAGMDADRRIDDVGNRQRRLEHVEMAVGERVEGPGIDGDASVMACCF